MNPTLSDAGASDSASGVAGTRQIAFEAEVVSVKPGRSAAGGCVETDCRFVARLKVMAGGADRLRAGDVLAVGIHSPARFFRGADTTGRPRLRFVAGYSAAGALQSLRTAP